MTFANAWVESSLNPFAQLNFNIEISKAKYAEICTPVISSGHVEVEKRICTSNFAYPSPSNCSKTTFTATICHCFGTNSHINWFSRLIQQWTWTIHNNLLKISRRHPHETSPTINLQFNLIQTSANLRLLKCWIFNAESHIIMAICRTALPCGQGWPAHDGAQELCKFNVHGKLIMFKPWIAPKPPGKDGIARSRVTECPPRSTHQK